MIRSSFTVILGVTGLLLSAVASPPLHSQADKVQGHAENSRPPRPGDINYVENQVWRTFALPDYTLGTEALNPNSAGSTELDPGQSLTTQAGKAEVVLTPGAFLRVASLSTVVLFSLDLDNTEVEVEKGRAIVEVMNLRTENNVWIDEGDVRTKLIQNGLYEFDAERAQIQVFKGAVMVHTNGENIKVTGGREIALNGGGKPKVQGFDSHQFEDDFFRWSTQRSEYLTQTQRR